MILRISLLFSCFILVSTNTGFPAIPAQTYPIYQQNGQANTMFNQPNNIAPYLQNTLTQNQSPQSPSSNLRQIILNKMLTSPSLQSILSPNLGGYGSNLFNSNPIAQNNIPIAQNPVSNYFEARAYESKQIDLNKESNPDNENEKPKKSKRKSSKSRKKQEASGNEKDPSRSPKRKSKHTAHTVEATTETSKKSKKRKTSNHTTENSLQNKTKNKETENNADRKTKRRENKENEPSKTDSADKEIKAENTKSRRRRKKKPKSDGAKENVSELHQTTSSMAQTEIKEGIDVVNFNEGVVEENRLSRNSKPEGNDLLKAFQLPENTGTDFMKTLSQFENNPYMNNFFANYENIYQSMLASGVGRNEKKEKIKTARRKRTRKHDKRKNALTKTRNSTEVATALTSNNTPKVDSKINMVTTERTIIIKEKKLTNVDAIPKEEGLQSIDKKSEVTKEKILKEDGYYENTNQDLHPDALDNEHFGYIEDYYPLFTDSAAYNANNREVYVKNLGDTKYYYAIDKSNSDGINRRRFEHYQFPERVVKDYEVNKRYDDTEKESIKNLKTDNEHKIIEEIQFRSPPHLELPDFQTRKIDKSEIDLHPVYNFEESNNVLSSHRFVGDKSQIDDKSHYKETPNTIKSKNESKDIETAFARSKVVRYGSVISSEENDFNFRIDKPVPAEESHFKDEDTVYVFAKPLDLPDTIW